MVFTELFCAGYRAFSAPTLVKLSNFNVIFGKNNSGKTTLARLPIFAAASLLDRAQMYALRTDGLRFGSSFLGIANAEQAHPALTYAISWESGARLGVELQHVTTDMEQERIQPTRLYLDDKVYDIPLRGARMRGALDEVRRAVGGPAAKQVDERCGQVSRIRESLLHIPSGRNEIASTYHLREPSSWAVDEVPYILAKHRRLMDQVSGWFEGSLDGIRIALDQAGFAFRLVELRGLPTVSLSESGRGTQSALPVVALLHSVMLAIQTPVMVIVEEPEEHLHPSAHGAIADLLIECSRTCQVLVETHSENLILRVRRRIAEGRLRNSDVALHYLDENQVVQQVELDEFGNALNWPAGVFETDVAEARAMVEAKLTSMPGMGQR